MMSEQERRDREEIRVLMMRYHVNGDSGRVDGLAATFEPDGILEFGDSQSRGPAEIVAWLSGGRTARDPALTFVRHNLTTSLIDFEGEEARGRSYFVVFTDIGLDHMGVYTDRFHKVDGAWRFAHRKVKLDWRSPQSLFGGGGTAKS